MLIVFVVVALSALRELAVEATINVEFEDMKLVAVDQRYFDKEKTEVYIMQDDETEESSAYLMVTLIKKLPLDAETRFKVTAYSMGKYSIPTGVDIRMTLCDTLDDTVIMGPLFTSLGFSKDECPPEPGIYSKERFTVSPEVLPEEYPENKYLLYIDINQKGKPLWAFHVYTDVKQM